MMKKHVSFISVLYLLFILISCGGGGKMQEAASADYGAMNQRRFEEFAVSADAGLSSESLLRSKAYAAPEAAPPSESSAMPIPDDRKLIKTTQLRIRVEDLSASAETINAMMKNFGAYSSSTQIEENRQTYHIRVPVTSYETMLNQVNGLGKVSSRSDSAEDVTLQYYDLEGRFDMRRELLQTYRSYLGRTENIEEILSVEKKIAELQNEIDMYGSQFTLLNNQIDYATIILTLYGPTTASAYEAPSIWDRISDIFGTYGDFLSEAVLLIIRIIVYGIPVLAAMAFLFWLLLGKVGLLRKLWYLVANRRKN